MDIVVWYEKGRIVLKFQGWGVVFKKFKLRYYNLIFKNKVLKSKI